jgi:hypothetical protein
MRLCITVFVALLPAAVGIAPPAARAATPLAAQYHVDDLSGADSSGNGLSGAAGPGATLVPGRFGNAVHPVSGSGLTVPGSPLLRPATVSLVLWFKQSGDPGTLKYLASGGGEGPGGCNGSPYAMYTHYQAGQGLSFYVRGISGTPHLVSAGTGVWDGNWHLAVGTFTRLYVDGAQVGSPMPSPDTINYGVATDQTFRIGEYSAQAGCGPSSSFPGALDEVRVYDRALSAAEIARLAAATGPEPPVLVPDGGGGGGDGGGDQPTPVGPTPIRLGPGQGSNPPLISNIKVTGPSRIGGLALATATVEGAARIDWDLSGDGKTDLSCAGNQTAMGAKLTSGITRAATGGAPAKLISFKAISPGGVASAPSTLRLPTTAKPASTPTSTSSTKLLTLADLGMCMEDIRPDAVVNGIGKLLSIDLNCTRQTVAFGIVEASGCFVHANSMDALPTKDRAHVAAEYRKLGGNPDGPVDMWLSAKDFKLNGLDVKPFGAPVVIFPGIGRVISRSATVRFGPVTVRSTGQVNLDVRAQAGARHTDLVSGKPINNPALGQSGGATIDNFDAIRTLKHIGGFALDGAAQAQLQLWSENGRRFAEATVYLALPDVFTAFGGRPPSAGARVVADNQTAPTFDGIDLRVPELEIGPVELTDVAFHYNATGHFRPGTTEPVEPRCDGRYWSATANIYIGDKSSKNGRAGFLLAPGEPQNGVHFCNGGFLAAGGRVVFGGPIPPPTIFPGLTLQEVSLGVQLDPPLIHGGVTMAVAEVAKIKGDLLLVLASPGSPYTITTQDAASFAAVSGTRLVAPTVAAGGEVSLQTPLGDLAFGSAHLLYEYPDYVDLGGSVSIVVPGIRVTGALRGQFRGSTRQFNIEGSVTGCIAVDLFCGTAAAWLSDRGVAVCFGDIVKDDWVPGAGYGWGNLLPDIWLPTGCKPSRYWDHAIAAPRSARAAAASAPVTFEVGPDEDVKSVELIGAGGQAPIVTLTGPDGEAVSVGPDTKPLVHTKRIGLARASEQGITVAGVLKGKPGKYTITPADGSPAIAKVKETRDDDGEGITARVKKDGDDRYVLEYDAGAAGGKEVTFAEAGPGVARTIKTVKGGKGKVAFDPQEGRAGTREVVAHVTLDGKAVPDQVVARFKTPDEVTPGAVRDVEVQRRGETLTVRWDAAINADTYGIVVRQANGDVRTLAVKATVKKPQATLKGVSEQFGGTVTVTAEGGLPGVYGKDDAASFKATAPEASAFLPYRELGARQAEAKAKDQQAARRQEAARHAG